MEFSDVRECGLGFDSQPFIIDVSRQEFYPNIPG